jgi:hypothetical protein
MAEHAGVWNGYGNDRDLGLANLAPIMHRQWTLPGEVERGGTGRPARTVRRRASHRRARGVSR